MKNLQIVVCGVGGQGIVFATRVLARVAGLEGQSVISTEFKGMAQRRASVVSFVKIGDFAGPSIRRGGADLALCLDAGEAMSALSYVRAGGLCVVNGSAVSPEATEFAARSEIVLRIIEAGTAKSSNVVLLGAAGVLPSVSCRRAIEELSPSAARAANLAAFDGGCREAVRVS